MEPPGILSKPDAQILGEPEEGEIGCSGAEQKEPRRPLVAARPTQATAPPSPQVQDEGEDANNEARPAKVPAVVIVEGVAQGDRLRDRDDSQEGQPTGETQQVMATKPETRPALRAPGTRRSFLRDWPAAVCSAISATLPIRSLRPGSPKRTCPLDRPVHYSPPGASPEDSYSPVSG